MYTFECNSCKKVVESELNEMATEKYKHYTNYVYDKCYDIIEKWNALPNDSWSILEKQIKR